MAILKGKKDKDKGNSKGPNSYTWLIIVTGALLFGLVVWLVINNTRSISAVVPNQPIAAGTTITPNMLKKVDIPVNTPSGYITDENSLIGQKIKVQAGENQMLYPTDIQTSFNMFGNDVEVPKHYVLTNINVDDSKAVDGLISSGDSVDLAGVPNSTFASASSNDMEKYLGGIAKNNFGANGVNGYWILGNVKILQSFKTQEEQANASGNNEQAKDENNKTGVKQGSYVVALSYADYKKVLIAEQYLDFHLNISPRSGYDKDLMNIGKDLNELKNAQDQQGKDGEPAKEKSKDKK